QCEALTMIAAQVMALDVGVTFGAAGGHLEMNVYKPLIIHNVMASIRVLSDGMVNFRKYLVDGMEPNRKQIAAFVERSLMLVTALSPVIGYDAASRVAHYALHYDLSLKEAALKLGVISSEDFDRIVDPAAMVRPN
ncbi:MAG: class II fumarate hydratase, partial [Alphaproteobacteria bacterium]|nr:class II fumarate hydratase [Alphaproteobacteria bacterium]